MLCRLHHVLHGRSEGENRHIRKARQSRRGHDAFRQRFTLRLGIIVTTRVVGFGGQSPSNKKPLKNRPRLPSRVGLTVTHASLDHPNRSIAT